MFVLVNEFGNIYKEVSTEREKHQLLKQGYSEVKTEGNVKQNSGADKTKKAPEKSGA